ncbi:hypothetical protein PaecuDRAFT_0685 [Paenibacillus curdlanolyticus YK9]|uniref:Uncharacterized protein n=1 Tax=Paenibacillus curdlanolyticus YK9 TaxID=717606 RepID=E0I4W3_9BACL|nr:hypothetical protein PaecuDRAFT_0685 [Paenibacillus curdlanolyticus YK9]
MQKWRICEHIDWMADDLGAYPPISCAQRGEASLRESYVRILCLNIP